jgi:hypothetical protein
MSFHKKLILTEKLLRMNLIKKTLIFIWVFLLSPLLFADGPARALKVGEVFQLESIQSEIKKINLALENRELSEKSLIDATVTHLRPALSVAAAFFDKIHDSNLTEESTHEVQKLKNELNTALQKTIYSFLEHKVDLNSEKLKFLFNDLHLNIQKLFPEYIENNNYKIILNSHGIEINTSDCLLAQLRAAQ